ncbi:MAG: hypothetical protein WC359_11860 [Dehalococcoidia bacterium]
MKRLIIEWAFNNIFWSSVAILFVIFAVVILVIAPTTILEFIIWIFWRIFDCTKFPITVVITIIKFLQEMGTGDIASGVQTAFMSIAGIFLYPFQFIAGLISDMGKGDFAKGFALLLSTYAVIGSIFWSWNTKKKGVTLMTIGFIYLMGVVAFTIWTLSSLNNTNENNAAVIVIVYSITSLTCLIFGTRRLEKYENKLSNCKQHGSDSDELRNNSN